MIIMFIEPSLFGISSTFLYLKFLLVWALVLMADFILDFRFEYLWPFWLLLRSVYDSFKYQGLVSTFHKTEFSVLLYILYVQWFISHCSLATLFSVNITGKIFLKPLPLLL